MSKLPITEELDFQYLLGLMPPLHDVPEFSWLPELFSIIGYEKLLLLCKYAGGETIKIPTVEQVQESIDALQWICMKLPENPGNLLMGAYDGLGNDLAAEAAQSHLPYCPQLADDTDDKEDTFWEMEVSD